MGEKMDNRPIGVFDSGLGGLTVHKEIMNMLKNESIVYFGDSGRAPYGTKSKETVVKYTRQDIRFLLSQDVKMVVIGCNTASACSSELVRNEIGVPVIEVVEPGAITAVRETKNKRIGVIGTTATINSGVYERAIDKIDNSMKIFSKACPMFVPLVEEGWWDNDIAYRIAEEYLESMKEKEIDTLVLGCTHYPLLGQIISKVLGNEVKLVNSALEASKFIRDIISKQEAERDSKLEPFYKYYTSDSVERFEKLGNTILNGAMVSANKVDIEKY